MGISGIEFVQSYNERAKVELAQADACASMGLMSYILNLTSSINLLYFIFSAFK